MPAALLLAIVVVLLVVVAVGTCRAAREGMFPYSGPVPGDPDRNILRRSVPSPPGRYPYGGLLSYYFQSDPAIMSGYEDDYCIHSPAACASVRP